jgi:hypothetical protein
MKSAGQPPGSDEPVGSDRSPEPEVDWAALIRKVGPRLVGYFRRKGIFVPYEDIEDGLAEAIRITLCPRSTYDPGKGDLVGWLFVVAKNQTLNILNKKLTHLGSARDLDGLRIFPQASETDEPNESESKMRRDLVEVLVSLPEADRLFILAYAESGETKDGSDRVRAHRIRGEFGRRCTAGDTAERLDPYSKKGQPMSNETRGDAVFDMIARVAPEVRLRAAFRDEGIDSDDGADTEPFSDERVARILRAAGITDGSAQMAEEFEQQAERILQLAQEQEQQAERILQLAQEREQQAERILQLAQEREVLVKSVLQLAQELKELRQQAAERALQPAQEREQQAEPNRELTTLGGTVTWGARGTERVLRVAEGAELWYRLALERAQEAEPDRQPTLRDRLANWAVNEIAEHWRTERVRGLAEAYYKRALQQRMELKLNSAYRDPEAGPRPETAEECAQQLRQNFLSICLNLGAPPAEFPDPERARTFDWNFGAYAAALKVICDEDVERIWRRRLE